MRHNADKLEREAAELASQLAAIEARLDQLRAEPPHYDEYVRALRERLTEQSAQARRVLADRLAEGLSAQPSGGVVASHSTLSGLPADMLTLALLPDRVESVLIELLSNLPAGSVPTAERQALADRLVTEAGRLSEEVAALRNKAAAIRWKARQPDGVEV